jgi:hypothetical protein
MTTFAKMAAESRKHPAYWKATCPLCKKRLENPVLHRTLVGTPVCRSHSSGIALLPRCPLHFGVVTFDLPGGYTEEKHKESLGLDVDAINDSWCGVCPTCGAVEIGRNPIAGGKAGGQWFPIAEVGWAALDDGTGWVLLQQGENQRLTQSYWGLRSPPEDLAFITHKLQRLLDGILGEGK